MAEWNICSNGKFRSVNVIKWFVGKDKTFPPKVFQNILKTDAHQLNGMRVKCLGKRIKWLAWANKKKWSWLCLFSPEKPAEVPTAVNFLRLIFPLRFNLPQKQSRDPPTPPRIKHRCLLIICIDFWKEMLIFRSFQSEAYFPNLPETRVFSRGDNDPTPTQGLFCDRSKPRLILSKTAKQNPRLILWSSTGVLIRCGGGDWLGHGVDRMSFIGPGPWNFHCIRATPP